MARPSAWPWAGWVPAVAAGSPCSCSRRAARSSSVITVKSSATRVDAGERRRRAPVTRLLISLRSGQPATVRATVHARPSPPSIADVADHAEVDDAAVQLGVLDGAEGVDDLVGW